MMQTQLGRQGSSSPLFLETGTTKETSGGFSCNSIATKRALLGHVSVTLHTLVEYEP